MNTIKKTVAAATALAAILLLANSAPAQDCGNLCSASFWETATVSDVKRELAQGVDPRARTGSGSTPLHWAVIHSETPAVVELLLDRGADLKARGKGGETPLHVAALASKTPEIVELLLDCGANPKAKDDKGKVPFNFAKKNKALANTNVYWRLNEGTY
ncbi:MAG: ankyrin repeat domain-containing protein [Gammaproteobacteria bacterium]|nr:ankyrin repeat domain-containing protein [Gammaproteobacteria bacterium]